MRKLCYTLLLSLLVTGIFAAAFTPGNIVVVRVGTGTGTLTTAATAVFLDEYSSTTGTLVQSVSLPTANNGANNAFTLSGTSTSEGALSLSSNGLLLTLAGYDTTTGVASVNSNAAVNRVIATVNGSGTINTATGIKAGGAYSANTFRAAATVDGTSFYTAGAGTGGTYYLSAGAITASPVKISNAPTNTRIVNIFGGQVYTSSSSSSYYTVASVGTGLPTTTGQTTTVLPGLPNASTGQSYYGFQLLDVSNTVTGVDVLYVTDDATGSTGGIYKFSLVNGNWTANGQIAKPGLRGITMLASCVGVGGFVSNEDSIYRFVDNAGYNQTISGTLVKVAGAGSNQVFRGLSFAPGTTATGGLTASITNFTGVSCFGNTNGTATVTVTGGTPTYGYAWSGGGAATATRNNLAAGSYVVTVTDQLGCSDTAKVTISQPAALAITIADTAITCNNYNNGKLGAVITGGTPIYTATWNDNSSDLHRTNLVAGTYTLNVTDSKGCTASASKILTNPAALQVTFAKTDITCGSTNNGTATATANGGTAPYGYVWYSGTSSTDSAITGLTAKAYSVNVTDAHGCSVAGSVTITQTGNLAVTGTVTNVACNSGSTGAIDISVLGGVTPYNYDWADISSIQEDRTGLAAGTYTVLVTDNNACSGTQSFTLTQPVAPLAVNGVLTNIDCYGGATGAIDVTVAGGTPTYTYKWNSAETIEDRTALAAGRHTVTVTDSKGCTEQGIFDITQGDSIAITAVITNVKCFGGANGAINVTVAGGSPTYSYNWGATTTEDRNNIAQGSYSLTVTDSKSCTRVNSFTVTQPAALTANAGTNVSIPTGGTTTLGTAQTASGGTAPYAYAWTPATKLDDASAARPVAANVTANTTYAVLVTDANNCTASASIVVNVTPLGLSETAEGLALKVLYLGNGEVAFALENTSAEKLTMNIFNANGQVVFSEVLAGAASQRVSIPNISELSSGLYIARFDANGKAVAKSFVVNK
jgi:hypothetical protein